MSEPIEKIKPIPRGRDLTEEDLRLIVDDFYEVRNWAALKMRIKGVGAIKEQLLKALEVRLGRRDQAGEVE